MFVPKIIGIGQLLLKLVVGWYTFLRQCIFDTFQHRAPYMIIYWDINLVYFFVIFYVRMLVPLLVHLEKFTFEFKEMYFFQIV